ncbi:hypothetical protein D3C84_962820 [compost metagenome]
MEIGARAAIFGIPGRRDPITGLAARVDYFDRRRGAGAMPEAGQLDAADVFQRQVGDVHVEYRARWQVEIRMSFHQLARKVRRCGQVLDLA